MVLVRTESGFETELDENVVNNMELVDALAEMKEDDPIALSKVCRLLLGTEKRKALYEHLRKEDGRVPLQDVNKALTDIIYSFGEKGKN